MPARILHPYFDYINNFKVKFQVGKTIGEEHQDGCSIPQGCPFSMTMVALLMMPWLNLMKDIGVQPRVLADDLMFTAAGTGHRAKTDTSCLPAGSFSVTLEPKWPLISVSLSPLTKLPVNISKR